MKRVLILSSYCYEQPSTNGICAIALNRALLRADAQTCMIGYGDETTILTQPPLYTKLTVRHREKRQDSRLRISAKVHALAACTKRIICPAYDRKTVDTYYGLMRKLYEIQGFDVIVAMFLPLEFSEAAKRIKKELPQVKLFFYELDSVTDGIHSSGWLAKLHLDAYRRFMVRQYKAADKVFLMEAHAKHANKLYPAFSHKFVVTDIPVLVEHDTCHAEGWKETVDFFYTGILDKAYRSPEKLLQIFADASGQTNWRFHFYSKGDCEEQIQAASQCDARIIRHGYVPLQQLELATDNADFFISIGNANSNSVPSKLINYISYGRPIIHVSLQKNDVCAEYLSKYPLALVISMDEPEEVSRERMVTFVAANGNKRIPFDVIKGQFYMNTPEYSAELILESMEQS